MVYSP